MYPVPLEPISQNNK